jgi:hypothetical protein
MAGRNVLGKAVLTSVVIYFITILVLPVEVLLKIESNRRADIFGLHVRKSRGGKCKVNRELVCKPKIQRGSWRSKPHKICGGSSSTLTLVRMDE